MNIRTPYRRLRVACSIGLALSLVPSVAHALSGPMLAPAQIFSEGFEGAAPARLTLDWILSTGYPTSAYWGPITQQKHSGTRGLWCAGTSIAAITPPDPWVFFGGRYPDYTAGLATFDLPELSGYYSATLDFWYRIPSLGSEDGSSFNVKWSATGSGDYWNNSKAWPVSASWAHAVMDMTAPTPAGQSRPVSLSRTTGKVEFQFMDNAGNPGESPTTGEGPTIDDVTVSGYKYGPVRDLAVSFADSAAHLTWSVPVRSTAPAAADEERPLAYRVYRELDGSNVWTELTTTRIPGTSFYDLDTSVPAGTYRYVVQSWDTGSGTGYGQVSMSGDTATQFLVGPPHSLSYMAAAHGSIDGSSAQVVDFGGSGTAVTAVPVDGYHFLTWSDGVLTASRTDLNVIENLSVSASFGINSYQLTYSAGAGGTISGTSPQTVDFGGTGTAVTAIPNPGYHFVSWSDGNLAAARTDSAVSGNLSVTANFAINTYQLTYTAGAGGAVTGTSPQAVAYNGSGTAVTAVASGGHHFVAWSDGKVTALRTDSGVTSDLSVSAVFAVDAITPTLAYTAGAGGWIVGSATQVVVLGGSGTAVTATPNTGFHFVSWSDGNLNAARTDTNVTVDILVSATFAINRYQLHYSTVANGTISGTASQSVDYNGSGTAVTAVPAVGYHFLAWSDGHPTAARTDVGVTGNTTPSATFAINAYTLTYSAGANGTISGASDQSVNHGGSGTAVTAVPSAGHHFVSWSDGGLIAMRTDTNVTGNLSVSASFAIDLLPPVFTITGIPANPTTLAVTPWYDTSESPAPTVDAWMDGTPFTMGTSYSADGTHTLVVRLTAAGSTRTTRHSTVFVIDRTAPVTTNNLPTGVALTAVTVVLNATDSVVGVAGTYCSIDGAAFKLYTGGVRVTSWKDHTVDYYSVDLLGNREATHHARFSMRNPTAVSISSSPASTTRYHAVTVAGYLTPGAHNDHIVVQYQKPGSTRWYSVTVHVGTVYSGLRGKWSYRYTTSVRGTYHFKASFAGTASRYKAASRTLSIVVR